MLFYKTSIIHNFIIATIGFLLEMEVKFNGPFLQHISPSELQRSICTGPATVVRKRSPEFRL